MEILIFDMLKVQKQIKVFSTKYKFDSESVEQKFLLLIEEVGEFAKAARKNIGMKTGSHSKDFNLEEEAADVFYVLNDIANKLGIDLEKSLNKKLEGFKKRKYK